MRSGSGIAWENLLQDMTVRYELGIFISHMCNNFEVPYAVLNRFSRRNVLLPKTLELKNHSQNTGRTLQEEPRQFGGRYCVYLLHYVYRGYIR